MGKRAKRKSKYNYSRSRFLNDLIRIAGASGQIDGDPVIHIAFQTGQGCGVVIQYLHALEASREITLVRGGDKFGNLITCVKVGQNETSTVPPESLPPAQVIPISDAVEVVHDVQEDEPIVVESDPDDAQQIEEPPATVQSRLSRVAVLVDYDNCIGHAREAHYGLSFTKLRSVTRIYGVVVFSDVFISARTFNMRAAATVAHAGFQVVFCPMASKDKDSVDSKMKERARKYLEHADIDLLVIVSQDQDFCSLIDDAADLHKKIEFIYVGKERDRLQGIDDEAQLLPSRDLSDFIQCIDYIADGLTGLRQEQGERIRFLKDMIRRIAKMDFAKPVTFRILSENLWQEIRESWSRIFTQAHLRTALTALCERDVLRKNPGRDIVYYTFNREHNVVKKALKG